MDDYMYLNTCIHDCCDIPHFLPHGHCSLPLTVTCPVATIASSRCAHTYTHTHTPHSTGCSDPLRDAQLGEIQYLIRLEELGADSASDDGPSSMATYRYCTYDDVPLRLPVGLATTTVLPSTYDFVMGGASRRRLSDSPL